MDKLKYWYVFHITECVLCGRTKKEKWRVYEEPAPEKKYEYEQDACSEHFI